MAIHWDAVPESLPSVVANMKTGAQTILHAICLVVFFFTLATNEVSQRLKFLCTTRLDSARIVKNITRMIGKYKFIIDDVLAALAPCQ
jgi:hypothetical protein